MWLLVVGSKSRIWPLMPTRIECAQHFSYTVCCVRETKSRGNRKNRRVKPKSENTKATTMKIIMTTFLMIGGLGWAQSSQAPNPTQDLTEAGASSPLYRVTVVARTTKAINYNHRSGSTRIGFQGTALMPAAAGEAKVESKQGVIKIDADMQKLGPATQFGHEYLTYVMWAVTPEGRATNIGEVLLNDGKSRLDATTQLQSFGLIVTAEPYFAVTQPSDVVVMENFVRQDTTGTIEQVDAKYELLQRGQYVLHVNPSDISAQQLDPKVPLELYEARNAVQIARWTGAQHYAPDTFLKATQGLENAEGYLKSKSGKKPIGTVAREAVQMAEDARIITIKKIDEELLVSERQAAGERESRAENGRAIAQSETERVTRAAEEARINAQSDADRVRRENEARTAASLADAANLKRDNDSKMLVAEMEAAQLKRDNDAKIAAAQTEANRVRLETAAHLAGAQTEADRLKQDSDAKLTAAQMEAAQLKRDNDAKIAAAQTEADRVKLETAAQLTNAQTEADRLKQDSDAKITASQNESDRLKAENEAQRVAALAQTDRAATEKKQLESDQSALRARLLIQFNAILQTRDTARGLIVNMSDVLFDTGKFSLLPGTREKLAKVAGILLSHPELALAVEGHTDSVGGEDYNQNLSEQRGSAVRDYLIKEGIAQGSVTSRGFGKDQPVASNETAAGRQQNRRVELVISGDGIGVGH
jgi:outer membrane protein OmpA-like peptidoglycan-associated protein